MDRCQAHQLPPFVASPQNIGFWSGALIMNRHCACLRRINDTECLRSGAGVGASVEPIAQCPPQNGERSDEPYSPGRAVSPRANPLVMNGNSPGRPIVVARQRPNQTLRGSQRRPQHAGGFNLNPLAVEDKVYAVAAMKVEP